MLTIIATRARYAMEANVLLRKASSRLSGATRLKIGLQYDPRIALDVV